MKIGFYLIDTQTLDSMCGYACAQALIASARRVMPTCQIVHFTDDISPSVEGVDETIRLMGEPMARLRMRHHASVTGNWVFVDTDVVFQADVQSVFTTDFDIAVADRDWEHVKAAAGFTDRMPFNMGVVFSRTHSFWAECYARVRQLEKPQQRWMGDQEVFCELIEEGRFTVHQLPGSVYNFPPSLDDNDVSRAIEAKAAIVHFKGAQRKPMMLRRIGAQIP